MAGIAPGHTASRREVGSRGRPPRRTPQRVSGAGALQGPGSHGLLRSTQHGAHTGTAGDCGRVVLHMGWLRGLHGGRPGLICPVLLRKTHGTHPRGVSVCVCVCAQGRAPKGPGARANSDPGAADPAPISPTFQVILLRSWTLSSAWGRRGRPGAELERASCGCDAQHPSSDLITVSFPSLSPLPHVHL